MKSTILYALGHVLDLVTTYLVSPDLQRETNVMVERFGFGWGYILTAAVLTSAVMLAVLGWMWTCLVARFPASGYSYGRFYRSILYSPGPGSMADRSRFATGMFVGVICISAYAAITTKLITGIWNLAILAFGVTTDWFLLLVVVKACLAAGVGLVMFFWYPYRLYHKFHES